jgi:hypothetical protein
LVGQEVAAGLALAVLTEESLAPQPIEFFDRLEHGDARCEVTIGDGSPCLFFHTTPCRWDRLASQAWSVRARR